jgi:hypothetical protein
MVAWPLQQATTMVVAPTVDYFGGRGRWGNGALGSREGGDGAGVHCSGRGSTEARNTVRPGARPTAMVAALWHARRCKNESGESEASEGGSELRALCSPNARGKGEDVWQKVGALGSHGCHAHGTCRPLRHFTEQLAGYGVVRLGRRFGPFSGGVGRWA